MAAICGFGQADDKVSGVKGLIEDAAERALRGLEPEQDVPLPQGELIDVSHALALQLKLGREARRRRIREEMRLARAVAAPAHEIDHRLIESLDHLGVVLIGAVQELELDVVERVRGPRPRDHDRIAVAAAAAGTAVARR